MHAEHGAALRTGLQLTQYTMYIYNLRSLLVDLFVPKIKLREREREREREVLQLTQYTMSERKTSVGVTGELFTFIRAIREFYALWI
jgi:hypothetical protein